MRRPLLFLFSRLMRFLAMLAFALAPSALLAQKEYYTPKSLLIPLHDQRNQLHVSVGRGGGYDLHVSYAFTDHLAFFHTATFDNGTKRRITVPFFDKYKVERNDYVLKGGLGYFMQRPTIPHSAIFEVYLGAGISNIDNYWHFTGEPDGELTQARYWSVFGQFNTGGKTDKGDYAAGFRLTYSRYTDFLVTDNYASGGYSFRNEQVRGFSFDPVCSASHNFNYVKLNMQAGFAIPVGRINMKQRRYIGSSAEMTSNEYALLMALLFRVSVQHDFNFGKKQ